MQQFRDVEKCRVLIVEDEVPQRNLFVEILNLEHIDVVGVLSSEEALKILHAAGRVSLLVTDIQLGEKPSGLELVAHARHIHPDIKIMFVTGYSESTSISKKAANIGDTIMFKPFKLSEFARQVNIILEKLPCHHAWLATTGVKNMPRQALEVQSYIARQTLVFGLMKLNVSQFFSNPGVFNPARTFDLVRGSFIGSSLNVFDGAARTNSTA